MSSTEQHIRAASITADSGTIKAIGSQSIVNDNALTTETLTVSGSAQVGGNLNVNGAIQVNGQLKLTGAVSFNDVALIDSNSDFTLNGKINANAACFRHDSIIGEDTFDGVWEGLISANNIRATNRLFVGDSPFKVDANARTVDADTFRASFAKVVTDVAKVASAEVETLRATGTTMLAKAEVADLEAALLVAKEIQVQSFSAVGLPTIKDDLDIMGNAKIEGGLTIMGANDREGGLVVNNFPAVFNWGIKVYHENGVLTQTLNVVGKSNTNGTSTPDEDYFALNTAIGIKSRFQGDVLVNDSKVVLSNSSLLVERDIDVGPLPNKDSGDYPSTVLSVKGKGDGFDQFVADQITYTSEASESQEDQDAGYTTREKIEARAAQPYDGPVMDITTPAEDLALARVRMARTAKEKQIRDEKLRAATRSFEIKAGVGKRYRLDAGGNALLKKAVVEEVTASTVSAAEICADTLRVNNFEMANSRVVGTMEATEGAVIGSDSDSRSQVMGTVYNYGKIVHKGGARVNFEKSSMLTIENGGDVQVKGTFTTSDGSVVNLHGEVEIDISKLVLFDSVSGKRFKINIRPGDYYTGEVDSAEGDEYVLEYLAQEQPRTVPVMTNEDVTKKQQTLRADLREFQEKLKRI